MIFHSEPSTLVFGGMMDTVWTENQYGGVGLSVGVVKLIHIYDTCFVGSIRVAIGSSFTPTLIHHPCFYSGEEALHGGRVA